MGPRYIPLSTVLAVGLAACSTMQVNSEYNPEARFEGLQTYAWSQRAEDERSGRRVAPVALRQLETSVDRELAAKGYRRVTSEPDFLVDFVVVSQDQIGETAVVTDDRLGWVSVTNRAYVERRGALVLEISDPGSGQMIWRGWASDVVRDPEIDVMVKKIDEAVTKILDGFPPER